MADKQHIYITTEDNPWDPAKDFDQWYSFDLRHGYNTCTKLARLMFYIDTLTPPEEELAREDAIMRLFVLNETGNRKLVYH